VPAAVFDAVNLGYTAVVVADAIAGVPAEYTPAMIRNTLSLVAYIATTDEVVSCWKGPRRVTRA
jgi:nicotinamidase-related amidase